MHFSGSAVCLCQPLPQLCRHSLSSCVHICELNVGPHREIKTTFYSHSGHWSTPCKHHWCALGAKDARHAYDVAPSPKIKHHKTFTKVKKKLVMKPPVPRELCSSRYSTPGNNRGIGGNVFGLVLFVVFCVCWNTPSFGDGGHVTTTEHPVALHLWVGTHSKPQQALLQKNKGRGRIRCIRRCFTMLHPLNPNDFSPVRDCPLNTIALFKVV